MRPMLRDAPAVEAAQWEPSTTLSRVNQRGSLGGSEEKASMPAPQRRPASSASSRAFSSMRPPRAVCIIGAGGSALSISAYLGNEERHGKDLPSRIHLNNRSAPRLAEGVRILEYLNVPMSYHLCKTPELNDRIVEALPAGSLVINATGLGKDRPGSPLTDHCKFPENGLVWELNYRGTLEFMHQAEAQRERRGLLIEDGWTYFIHGWTQVIAEVFHIDITGERLAACDRLAREMRK